ncbi:ornithine cyclodeaminase [Mesorhizobium albiziae]|uniref:Ornithine cyclodeaminase n=1 Tax=Neomesorhizobium albiziae TaxID=335020 RepID=A0A1I4CS33_9HYPH|nr:ectoine utilization protein EutC [Mesorhizobium albiziae]GLS30981.1 cyclodeaminase [Mesorhizobium albiziae]SFK83725.1 ornithine cyclodeaminase [Mesorhizobium albiziae]
MPLMTILTEAELRRVVRLDLEAVACVEKAFCALATEAVVMPPILRLDVVERRGEVDVKTAYVPSIDGFAVKISPGFFDNPKLGLSSLNGMMVLLSARTGIVEALLLDNGYLTDIRTAAAGAVAAKHLSRPDSHVAAIFGAGVQARLQLEALKLVRPIEEARLWARDPAKAMDTASELSRHLGIPVSAEPDPAKAAAGVDIIVTTTPATEPLILPEFLKPGQHITAMGSDSEHKNELAPGVFKIADLYVADSAAQTRRLGELHHAIDAEVIGADAAVTELGAVIAGKAVGRRGRHDITIADLTGTGVQDTAIAAFAHDRARAAKVGTPFES